MTALPEGLESLTSSPARVTGIGSMPHADIERACSIILNDCPDIPYCPQFSHIDPRESMFLQCTEHLPCLKADTENKKVLYDTSVDRDAALAEFYERMAGEDYDHFRISPSYSRGFDAMLKASKSHGNTFIKSQIIGPITFLSSVIGADNKALIYDPTLADATLIGLGMKGLWQAREIKRTGKVPIVFYDEPYLSSLGSAYMPMDKDKAATIIDNLVEYIKERDSILVGMHCCGNTDWDMLLRTQIDILSFDSFGFSEYFVLYADSIKEFLDRQGILAFGAVPTSEYTAGMTEEELYEKLDKTLDALERKGLDRAVLRERCLVTPACGMGLLPEKDADEVSRLTMAVADKLNGIKLEGG